MSYTFRTPIIKMSDGTIKQTNPFSDTEVWTIPGRAARPLEIKTQEIQPIDATKNGHHCAFCTQRILETPPEKARLVKKKEKPVIYNETNVDMLTREWEFRRIPNLFEIVSFEYWKQNYGFGLSRDAERRMQAYLADPAGRAHVMNVLKNKFQASYTPEEWDRLAESEKFTKTQAFFGSGHDLIIARRHFIDNAENTSQLASSGSLTPQEHEWYIQFTIEAMHNLYQANKYAKYVQVFQNWLKPAGASFDHLHKQLVSIDQRPTNAQKEIERLRENPNLFNEAAVDYAGAHNLVIAENKYAVAIAGIGHRYPTLEIWSRSAYCQPWEHSTEEIRGMSDLVHAMHAATGAHIPTNEEWYCKPIDSDVPVPWRVLIKWRTSTLAGFEGGTKIYVNTTDPWQLKNQVVPQLLELRAEGKIANNLNIASECSYKLNSLKYNPALQ